jgi:putative effector of murein hydrolase
MQAGRRYSLFREIYALLPFVISTILITLFLFFIDEGNYNFEWMANWGNWIVFFVYAFPVFFAQVLFSKIIFGKVKKFGNTLRSIFIGSLTGLTFVIGVFYSLG